MTNDIYIITFTDGTKGLVFDFGQTTITHPDGTETLYRLFSPYTDNRPKHWIDAKDIGVTVFLNNVVLAQTKEKDGRDRILL